jgi:hypothetical protein
VVQPTDDELVAACVTGTPIAGAAKYAGTVHPLVVVQEGNPGDWLVDDYAPYIGFDIDNKWVDNSWPGPIQLVVCIDNSPAVKVDSCGTYTRDDGVTGEVIRYKDANVVRILVASTGKLLQSKTFYGTVADCPTNFVDVDDPPWSAWGPPPDNDAAFNAYATAVSTQAVK